MPRACLDRQTGRCTDRYAIGYWSDLFRAYLCFFCHGIAKTDMEIAAGVQR